MPVTHDSKTPDNNKGADAKNAPPPASFTKATTKVDDALSELRQGAQDLHGALSDAAAKRGGAMKADLESLPQKAKAVLASLKASMSAETATAKQHLAEAVTHLEALQTHLAESLKSSGRAFENAVRHAVNDARSAAQKVSEAVADKRAARFAKPTKAK